MQTIVKHYLGKSNKGTINGEGILWDLLSLYCYVTKIYYYVTREHL